ncbi:membrane protein [Devosia yakushimensis]|uniref:Membrane protein n=1 Tax=Devosia yakushimensis TaxID=470028 RepID=A0ABQ5UDX8_9HYPH|nr:M23 family metallopeptidase [Devosia yakushimensis]GLQ09666.1 membrane protein [Devosia yakushimensis]
MRYSASFGGPATPAPAPRQGVRPALFYGMFATLLCANALTATAFVFSSDIAKLWNRQDDQVVAAYEDRIAQLRVEVDRLHSRSYAQAGDINLQLQELSQQQEVLLEQHQLVKVLVDKAGQLGIDSAALPTATGAPDIAPLAMNSGNAEIDATATAISQMMGETQFAMTSIAETATQRTRNIVTELTGLGIRVDLPSEDADGVGGPLLAAVDGADASSPMIDDANAVMAALVRYKAARDTIDTAPVHMPISGSFRQSSGFGNRTDPFTGRRAFHSGLDFAATSGTIVLSAGAGVVSFVGQQSGYGNVVEVTHANGLITRYAHLSGFLSEVGQRVNTGSPIAKVGSTGRSTGPHLHFEVRRDDMAINPKTFIEAGKRLTALLG